MDLATGAMGSLLPKLVDLVSDEYKLQKSVKEGVKSLEKEMRSMLAALCKVAEVPPDQLDGQLKLWAGEVRELSFDMEDVVDKFLVHVDDESEPVTKSNKLKRLTEKMASLFTKGKARHVIADAIKDIKKQVQEVADRHGRYNMDNIVAMPAVVSTIDPRLGALYKEVTDLVGIAGKRDQELMRLLLEGDNETKKKLKVVSVAGFGGLGKTTLVKTVYDKIKRDFDCWAFVPVGRNANAKKVLMDIFLDLDMYRTDQLIVLDERQLIDKLREHLENKRYLIVIDDIWGEELWRVIKWAFSSSNNFGSRLITTTRIVGVSKLCCSSANDSVYQMEPLGDEDSKRLFNKRIFSHESGCPRELEQVSIDILKKCGGVPLAINTIASLLAQKVKTVDEWRVLLGSISRGLTKDRSVKEMRRILSFSYYDLPSHLKTCLLYLSMFPEDHKIKKDRLIWMWIAESFVQFEEAESKSLFEIGESFFNELVNRNMIMPVFDDVDGSTIEACRVHDMVLDLISSLASEENFVSVLNGIDDSMSSQSNVRRLSLQDARKGELKMKPHESVVRPFQVRSVAAFGTDIGLMTPFSRFVVLRVLDLTGNDLADRTHLNLRDLGNLLHLRYLGLAKTGISVVPEEVGKLQFLQVLDLISNDCVKLPQTVNKLRRLMCLHIDNTHRMLPDGLGKLASMEVLSEIRCDSVSIVKELGDMERLRELHIRFFYLSLELEEAFAESLGKLPNFQILVIRGTGEDVQSMDHFGEHWTPPQSLREVTVSDDIMFSTLPMWIRRDSSHLSQLSVLHIVVEETRQEDLDILGRLPVLRSLGLRSHGLSKGLLVGADGFHYLTALKLHFSLGHIVFQPGAMPKVEIVYLHTNLRVMIDEAVGKGGDCSDLGMGNLMSIQNVRVTFGQSYDVGSGERSQAKNALWNALCAHPNRPTIGIDFHPFIPYGL